MACTFTSTMYGASPDYMKYLYGNPVKTDRHKDSTLLDFSLAEHGTGFKRLSRGAYITVSSDTYPKWFTGYVTNDPELTYLGSNGNTTYWGYTYQATSDEYLLSLKPIGVIAPFLNVRAGVIIKTLVDKLAPGVFDTSNIDVLNSPFIAQYAVEAGSKFLDLVQDLCEATNYLFYGNDKKLYYISQDSYSGNVVVDGSDTHFTPSKLELRPSSSQIVNDITVLGALEPQRYVIEYFIGTGLDATFSLISNVFGVDESVLVDETFEGSTIDGNKWLVYDSTPNLLEVSEGYLNCTGGTSNYGVNLRSYNPLPMEGNLRITHGEWDFLGGEGVIGGCWTQAPNTSYTGCMYGLKVNADTMNPIVNGVVDTSQSVTLSSDKRYVLRTLAAFSKVNRAAQTYSYISQYGVVTDITSTSTSDDVVYHTIITEINPTDGSITNQYYFTNKVSLTGVNDSYATYIPIASYSLHATVTGITLSVPINATLETADLVQFENTSFEDWLNDGTTDYPEGWVGPVGVSKEETYVNTGTSLKLTATADGVALLSQTAAGLIEAGKTYNISVRVMRGATSTTGTLRFNLMGTDVDTTGLLIPLSSASSDEYQTFVGTLTTGLTTVPSDLCLVIFLYGSVEGHVVWVDDITVTSEWQQQIIGPNEIDAVDGLRPVATIVNGNAGSTTYSSLTGEARYNQGQAQLVFFKDSVTLTSDVPPQNQLIRLTYRSSGSAVGRAINRASITTEGLNWGDDGIRSVTKSDADPRPRTSEECELAAAALVSENCFTHYEGSYTMWSNFMTSEPKAGSLISFTNVSSIPATLQAEEINQVVTTFLSVAPETFQHVITFGKPDRVRRLLNKFTTPQTIFQKTSNDGNATAVEASSVGTAFAPDVTNAALLGWDANAFYIDAGKTLDSDGLYYEVRYTDECWGVTDSRNLVTRSTSRYFTIPRQTNNLRGRTFFIRQANQGNMIKYSEDLTQTSVYSGALSVSKGLGQNIDGDLSDICTLNIGSYTSFRGELSGLSGSQFCLSFDIKGTAGKIVTVNLGTTSTTVTLCGQWQRVSVSHSGYAPSHFGIIGSEAITVDMTRVSVEQGTLVERSYAKTASVLYGPVSRNSAAIHITFPAPLTLANVDLTSLVLRPSY